MRMTMTTTTATVTQTFKFNAPVHEHYHRQSYKTNCLHYHMLADYSLLLVCHFQLSNSGLPFSSPQLESRVSASPVIVQRYLRDPTFIRISIEHWLVTDRQTGRQTNEHMTTSYIMLASCHAVKTMPEVKPAGQLSDQIASSTFNWF